MAAARPVDDDDLAQDMNRLSFEDKTFMFTKEEVEAARRMNVLDTAKDVMEKVVLLGNYYLLSPKTLPMLASPIFVLISTNREIKIVENFLIEASLNTPHFKHTNSIVGLIFELEKNIAFKEIRSHLAQKILEVLEIPIQDAESLDEELSQKAGSAKVYFMKMKMPPIEISVRRLCRASHIAAILYSSSTLDRLIPNVVEEFLDKWVRPDQNPSEAISSIQLLAFTQIIRGVRKRMYFYERIGKQFCSDRMKAYYYFIGGWIFQFDSWVRRQQKNSELIALVQYMNRVFVEIYGVQPHVTFNYENFKPMHSLDEESKLPELELLENVYARIYRTKRQWCSRWTLPSVTWIQKPSSIQSDAEDIAILLYYVSRKEIIEAVTRKRHHEEYLCFIGSIRL